MSASWGISMAEAASWGISMAEACANIEHNLPLLVEALRRGPEANVNDLVEFVRARLDEDERVAQAAAGITGRIVAPNQAQADRAAAHAMRHQPARVLVEVDAKRRILDELIVIRIRAAEMQPLDEDVVQAFDRIAGALALPYTDHPDYREEWRP